MHFFLFIILSIINLTCASPSITERALKLKDVEESGDLLLLSKEGLIADDFVAYLQGSDEPIVGKEGFEQSRYAAVQPMKNIRIKIENVVESGNLIMWEKTFTFESVACGVVVRQLYFDKLTLNEQGQIQKWEMWVDGGVQHLGELVSCTGIFTQQEILKLAKGLEQQTTMSQYYSTSVDSLQYTDSDGKIQCHSKLDCKKLLPDNVTFVQRYLSVLPLGNNTVLVNRDIEFTMSPEKVIQQRDLFKLKFQFPSGLIESFKHEVLYYRNIRTTCEDDSCKV